MKIEQVNELEEVFTQVTKEVIKDIKVSDVVRHKIHQSKDGTLYVLISMDNSRIKKQLIKSYKNHYNDAKVSKENLDQGMVVLDEMLNDLEEESL